MRIVKKRAVATAVLLIAALPGSAVADDGYAGFGDPTSVAPATGARAVLAAAPLPGGRALVLAATTGNQHVTAFDTGDPRHPHQLATGWGGTVVTWPDGRRLAVVTAADGIQTVAAGPDGAWGAPVPLGALRAGVSQVRAVALADGRAAIAWTTNTPGAPTSHLFAVATDAAGTPSAAPVDYGATNGFRLAAAPDGTAAVAFQGTPAPGSQATPTASVAILPHGAAAFGTPVSVPGPAGVPPIAVAADGSAVLVAVTDTRIARVASDGSALPDLPPLAGSQYHPGPVALDVAADGTVVLDGANPLDGWVLGGLRPDGTALPAVPGPATSPEVEGDVGVHAWPGGASVALVRGAVGDNSSPYAGVVVRDASGTTAGTVLAIGPDVAGFPDAAPATFDAYTISGGTLWRIARPGTPSRRAATLTTLPGQIRATQRVVGFHVAANQAGTATVTARIRRGAHGAWRTVKPTNGTASLIPFTDAYMTLPLSTSGSVCKANVAWTVVATARFVNRAGVKATTRLTYTRTCQPRHTPAR